MKWIACLDDLCVPILSTQPPVRALLIHPAARACPSHPYPATCACPSSLPNHPCGLTSPPRRPCVPILSTQPPVRARPRRPAVSESRIVAD